MANKTLLPDNIANYVVDAMTKESAAQKKLRAETAKLPYAQMQISADQGAFFAVLMHAIGAKRTLEVGTFTGYSALAVALALPPDGKVVACDINEEWTQIARRAWREAGVADKIELRLAPALDTLEKLRGEGADGTFDFAFIDADKTSYPAYYEYALKLVRQGGIIALDNMLWSGKVVDESVQDEDTKVLRALNLKIRDDGRVHASLLTIGDGILLLTKR